MNPYTKRDDVVCVDCKALWATRPASIQNPKAAKELVKNCAACVGTFRNPIPMAEIYRGYR